MPSLGWLDLGTELKPYVTVDDYSYRTASGFWGAGALQELLQEQRG